MREEYRRVVRWWLATGAFLVIAMVVVGGITRLTDSGLSMTDWKPLSGVIPPISQEEWQAEFDNYKQYPEYKELRTNFSLEDFKSIYWWEFIHRVLGRVVGLVFIIPYAFFLLKKVFDRKWNIRLLILLALGGFQGFLGWFMVKSGLVDRPDVSHYRLAIHLSNALLVFSYIAWLFMDLSPNRISVSVNSAFKRWSIGLLLILIVQIVFGAFVAGLKAGLVMNSWPLMGDSLVSPLVGTAVSSSGIVAFFEDPVAVQFVHRMIPYLILIPIIVLLFKTKGIRVDRLF